MQLRSLDLFTRLLRTRPLFTAALFFMLGCILAYSLGFGCAVWSAVAAFVLLLLFILRGRRRTAAALLVILMLPLGALRFDLAWVLSSPVNEDESVTVSGRICDDPFYNEETERCICVLDDISLNGSPFRGKLRLYLRGDEDLLQNVRLAQKVSCNAKLWQADEPGNEGEFNFANYLRISGLRGYATAKIEDAGLTEPDYTIRDLNNLLCGRISARIDRLFPENAAIVKAFILGDRSEMDDTDRASFNRTGAAHLLAISGMHISVLAMLVSWLFGRFLRKGGAFSITMLLLVCYGWLIGFTPSLVRAIIMFGIYQAAGLCGRYSDSPTRLAAAMLMHLLISPIDILSTGFILSYCASAGIVFLSRPLSRLLRTEELLYGSIDISPAAVPLRKASRWIMRSLITSLAATLATFPAVIHFFGAQPLWSMLVNLPAVPLAMFSYILSILGLLTGLSPLCLAADSLFELLISLIRLCAALPLSSLRIARFPAWLYVVCAAMFLISSDLSALPELLRRFLPVCTLLAMLLSNGISLIRLHQDEFIFLDAGQADCAILKTGGKVVLFDAGDDYTPASDYLSAMNYGIDALFLSHLHADHAGGLASILEICVPEKIYLSANCLSQDANEGILEAMNQSETMGSELVYVKTGDTISLSGESFAKVLTPDAGISASSANEDSMILHVVCGTASALFTGDMPAEAMPENLPDIDILKVAHHGSRSGVDVRTLAETMPSVAVISVGEANKHGHPSPEALSLLEAGGAQVFRTDLCGAITVSFDASGELAVSTHNNFGGQE